jgi:hypothetical protein
VIAVWCPSRDGAGLTDEEFWDRVYAQVLGVDYGPDLDVDDDEIDPPEITFPEPCPECGAYSACAYDDEGRALIHVLPKETTEP